MMKASVAVLVSLLCVIHFCCASNDELDAFVLSRLQRAEQEYNHLTVEIDSMLPLQNEPAYDQLNVRKNIAFAEYITWMRTAHNWIFYEQRATQEVELHKLLCDNEYVEQFRNEYGNTEFNAYRQSLINAVEETQEKVMQMRLLIEQER